MADDLTLQFIIDAQVSAKMKSAAAEVKRIWKDVEELVNSAGSQGQAKSYFAAFRKEMQVLKMEMMEARREAFAKALDRPVQRAEVPGLMKAEAQEVKRLAAERAQEEKRVTEEKREQRRITESMASSSQRRIRDEVRQHAAALDVSPSKVGLYTTPEEVQSLALTKAQAGIEREAAAQAKRRQAQAEQDASQQAALQARVASRSLSSQKAAYLAAEAEGERHRKVMLQQRSEFIGYAGGAGVGKMQATGLTQVGPLMADMGLSGVEASAIKGQKAMRDFQFTATGALLGGKKAAEGMASGVESIGTKGKFSVRVLEAFFLYRGFVFLEQSILNTTRAMVELDHRITLVRSLLGGIGGQAEITARIISIGRETGAAFVDLADAEYQIVSANVALADSYEVLALSSKAAIAGNTNVTTAFNSALSQVSAFGLEMENLSSVYDKQFSLVKRGIFTYEQYATVAGITAEAFAQSGQSMETQNAALAAMSEVFTGPQLQRGATALRSFTLAISDAPEKFAAIGISTLDTQGNIRGLIPILQDLKARFDGLPTGERARLIRDILPDKREQTGLVSLIANLDDLKRNYIDQKLALGEMNTAFETVAEDLKTQAGILKNNVTVGFAGVATPLNFVVTGMNSLDRALPGVTSLMVSAATAVTGLALAYSYLNYQVGTTAAGAAIPRSAQLAASVKGFAATPMIRAGVPLLAGAAAVTGGYQAGFSGGGLAASAAGGALAGALAFPSAAPAAALIGAALNSGAYYFSTTFHKEMDSSGRTFAKVFNEELAKGTSLKVAFEKAKSESSGAVAAKLEKTALEISRELPGFVAVPTSGMRMGAHYVDTAQETASRQAANLSSMYEETAARFKTEGYDTRQQVTDVFAGAAGSAFKSERGGEFDRTAGALASILISSGKGLSDFDAQLVTILSAGTPEKVNAALVALEASLGAGASVVKTALSDMVSGDFGQVADIFSHMGTEGERLAEVFRRVNTVMQGFEKLKTLTEATLPNQAANPEFDALRQQYAALARSESAAYDLIFSGHRSVQLSGKLSEIQSQMTATEAQMGRTPQTISSPKSALEMSGMSKADIEDIKSGGNEALLETVRGIFGHQQITKEEWIQYLFHDAKDEVELQTNSFADALKFAADGFRHGFYDSKTGALRLFDSMGYTADELEMLGEEFAELNKTVAKISMLKELEAIGQFLDPVKFGKGFLDPVAKTLAQQARLGGHALYDVLSDPRKIIDLLAEIQFGDVKVDNSVNQQIVLRIEGALDPEAAAKGADLLVELALGKMNAKQARRSA